MSGICIGFIGAGNMASAILSGIAPRMEKEENRILVYDLDTAKMRALAEKYPCVTASASAGETAKQANYLVLAVKPQNFKDVLTEIAPEVNRDGVIVSIAAGITAEYLKKSLGYDAKVVLVMPNTPLMLGCGAAALSCIPPTSREEFDLVRSLFDANGVTCEIAPGKMNESIPLHGSSPAFIYLFAKGYLAFAEENGIPQETALRLFCQTLIGSAKMMTQSGHSIDDLIRMVSSPGGTTLEGLQAFYDHDLEGAVLDACRRCTRRAYELSQ